MLIYNLGIYLFSVVLKILGLYDPRIKVWNELRANHAEDIKSIIDNPNNKPVIWMHCASLGEYEQGIIVLKKIKENYPNKYFILLSFFSPSGYLQKNKNTICDAVIYLPIDKKGTIEKFVEEVKPAYFIGVKYEFWWNLLAALKERNCKVIYISLLLKDDHYLYKFYGRGFLNQLKKVDHIFTQDDASFQKLSHLGFQNLHSSKDTRISSVAERKTLVKPIEELHTMLSIDKPVLIYGSIYLSDMAVIGPLLSDQSYYHVLVPHHVDDANIELIRNKTGQRFISYTSLKNQNNKAGHYGLIINTIGKLFDLYQYASFVYIGGGFEKGIHNTLEPAVFNVPLAFGPKYKKFPEAVYFIENGCAKEVSSSNEFTNYVKSILGDDKALKNIKQKNEALFIEDGAVEEIVQLLSDK
jgi:3-deoxy-D-manno-octulosonic-acid transferase